MKVTPAVDSFLTRFLFLGTLGVIGIQGFFSSAWAEDTATRTVRIAVLDDGGKHEKEVVSELKKLLVDCKTCKILSYPIYEKNGDLLPGKFIAAMKEAEKNADVVNLSWNLKSTSATQSVEEALGQLARKKILIAAAGAPDHSTEKGSHKESPSQALSTTVVGKIKEALIVGELNEKGFLVLNSFYGEEMFTALTPPPTKMGSSFSVIRLAAAVSARLASRGQSRDNLIAVLKRKKQESFKQYPSLTDLGLE